MCIERLLVFFVKGIPREKRVQKYLTVVEKRRFNFTLKNDEVFFVPNYMNNDSNFFSLKFKEQSESHVLYISEVFQCKKVYYHIVWHVSSCAKLAKQG